MVELGPARARRSNFSPSSPVSSRTFLTPSARRRSPRSRPFSGAIAEPRCHDRRVQHPVPLANAHDGSSPRAFGHREDARRGFVEAYCRTRMARCLLNSTPSPIQRTCSLRLRRRQRPSLSGIARSAASNRRERWRRRRHHAASDPRPAPALPFGPGKPWLAHPGRASSSAALGANRPLGSSFASRSGTHRLAIGIGVAKWFD
jgi:hypothetical protein